MWWVMLAGATVLFLLVMTLFVLVIRRPGWGSSVSPMRWIVLGGLALPAVVLLPLIAYALIVGERMLPLPGHSPLQIEASAQQWTLVLPLPRKRRRSYAQRVAPAGGHARRHQRHQP